MAQYIILPRAEVKAKSGRALDMLIGLPSASSVSPRVSATLEFGLGRAPLDIIDTTSENGPKLVEMNERVAQSLNDRSQDLRAVPLVTYAKPAPRLQAKRITNATQAVTLRVTDAGSGGTVSNAEVVAFTNFSSGTGDYGITDNHGEVQLFLGGNTIDRLYVYPPGGYWDRFSQGVTIQTNMGVTLDPIVLPYEDSVRYYYSNTQFDSSTGIKVGVVDSGVGPHNDLNINLGRNTVTGEQASDYLDSDGHGTHVAGLIGANGQNGLRGMAPNVSINAYRVFGHSVDYATNYSILKAMIQAASDRCDIINLSLGGGPADVIVKEGIQDARNQGMLVVIAAGNDGRQDVNYPAAYPGATAVSAMGREGTYPVDTLSEGDILRPPSGKDQSEVIARFSNVGSEIAVTGPGVGTLSTLPNNLYGPMSGTSMASPVVSGAAACLLSNNQLIFNMPRNRSRSNAIEQLLQSSCKSLGFGFNYEGYGMPDPDVV